MKKPESLRTHMLNAVKELQRDPDRLLIHTDNGKIRSLMANGLSFEYEYELEIILTEYAGELDAVMIPLLDWVRINQSDLLVNLDKNKNAFKFETVLLDNSKVDLALNFPITERVIVKRLPDGQLDISFPGEPQYETAAEPTPFKMVDHLTGEVLAEWMSADPENLFFGN